MALDTYATLAERGLLDPEFSRGELTDYAKRRAREEHERTGGIVVYYRTPEQMAAADAAYRARMAEPVPAAIAYLGGA